MTALPVSPATVPAPRRPLAAAADEHASFDRQPPQDLAAEQSVLVLQG